MKRLLLIPAIVLMFCLGVAVRDLSKPQIAEAASAPGTFQKVANQRGVIAATGVTGAVTGTTGLTTTKDIGVLSLENTSTVEMNVFSSDGAFSKILPASSFRVYDLKANGDVAYAPTTYKVYYTTSPSSGRVEIIGIPVR